MKTMFANRSIANKLILVITVCSTLIFSVSIGYIYYHSHVVLERELEEDARNLVLVSVNRIETVLTSIGKVTEGFARSLETGNYTEKSLDILLKDTLNANKDIFGISPAYEPDASTNQSRILSRFYYRKNGINYYRLWNNETDISSYRAREWYKIPREFGKIAWSEPYAGRTSKTLMTTCSVPFYEGTGDGRRFRGVVGTDVSLESLTSMVESIKVLKTGYSFLISRNGTILAHPSKKLIMNESIFSIAESRNLPAFREIGSKMIRGESDFTPYTDLRGTKSRMYYAPIPSTGWTLAIVFPESELFADLRTLTITVGCIGFAGVLLLAVAVALIARSITTPLHDLAEATEVIASGNFDAEMPSVHSGDEVGKLTQSFISMNKALKEYIRNLTETTAAKERIQSELRVATEIQTNLLPRLFPPFPDRAEFEIFASMDPAKEVGGDFYDFFFIDTNNLCFLIGDVADKGVPAALYMMVAKTLLKSEGQRLGEPDKILSCVNNILAADNESCMFASVFCAILDTRTGEIRFANAGHNPPLIIETGHIRYLAPKSGFVMGPMTDTFYETERITLQPGDTLFLYTDGVTEAKNPEEALYGEPGLMNALQQAPKEYLADMISYIREEVIQHANGAQQSDDITMVAIKYRGANG